MLCRAGLQVRSPHMLRSALSHLLWPHGLELGPDTPCSSCQAPQTRIGHLGPMLAPVPSIKLYALGLGLWALSFLHLVPCDGNQVLGPYATPHTGIRPCDPMPFLQAPYHGCLVPLESVSDRVVGPRSRSHSL